LHCVSHGGNEHCPSEEVAIETLEHVTPCLVVSVDAKTDFNDVQKIYVTTLTVQLSQEVGGFVQVGQ